MPSPEPTFSTTSAKSPSSTRGQQKALTPLPNGVEANSSNEWTTLIQSKSGGRIGLRFDGVGMLAEAKFPVWKGKRNFEIRPTPKCVAAFLPLPVNNRALESSEEGMAELIPNLFTDSPNHRPKGHIYNI